MKDAQDITIRPAAPTDAEAAMAVLRRSITELCVEDHRNDTAELTAWVANKTKENWHKWMAMPGATLLVAEMLGQIAGVGMMSAKGTIHVLYVSPDHRFQGVSTALLKALEQAGRNAGYRKIALDSTQTARQFYRGHGYRPIAEGDKRLEKLLN